MPQPPTNLTPGTNMDRVSSVNPVGSYDSKVEQPISVGASSESSLDLPANPIGGVAAEFHSPKLLNQLGQVVLTSQSFPALIQGIAATLSENSECLGLWGWEQATDGTFGPPVSLLSSDDAAEAMLWETLRPDAESMLSAFDVANQLVSKPLSIGDQHLLVACKVDGGQQPAQPLTNGMMLVGCFGTKAQTTLRVEWMFGLANQAITRWLQANSIKQMELHAQSMKDAFAIIHALDQTDSVHAATKIVANRLQRLVKADQVVVALGETPPRLKLDAISGVEQIEHQVEANRPMLAACQQATKTQAPILFLGQAKQSVADLSLENYCAAVHSTGGMCVPLIQKSPNGETSILGAILIAANAQQLGDENFREYVLQLVNMVSGHLAVVIRANQSLRGFLHSRLGRLRSHSLKKPILAFLGIAFGLLCIPMPYRVHCECELQPIHRRFIAAPYDGILESTKVERGDMVSEGQVLAHLDGHQLRMELSAIRAEWEGAKKRRESSLANGEIAQSQIAKSEMRRHQSRIDILEQQQKHLEVRSPIDGMVVVGDLEKAHGAPVEMGQTLFEVAPLDQMVAEIGIPEAELQYVEIGMPVTIKLDAFPFRSWEGTITLINPQAEIVDNASVFVAEVEIENGGDLKPGMQGAAKISTHWSPLAWNLFHRPWESVRYWTVW